MIRRFILFLFVPLSILLISTSHSQPLFSPTVVEIPAPGIHSYTMADFNGDGVADIAVLSNDPNSENLSIYLMQPSGWYSTNRVQGVEGSSIEAGDFNNDGNADLVVNDPNGYLYILLGYGNGAFSDPISIDVSDLGIIPPQRLGGVNYLDDDGYADIICGDTLITAILIGRGNGYFYRGGFFSIGGFFEGYAVLGDFNEDGSIDLILPKYRPLYSDPSDSIVVLLNDGAGGFSQAGTYPVGIVSAPFISLYSDIDVADLDGDGHLDIVSASSEYDPALAIRFLKGKGNGFFNPPVEFGAGVGVGALYPVDLNEDGLLDLAFLPRSYFFLNRFGLMLGKGGGDFKAPQWYPVLVYPYADKLDDFSATDLNGDGHQDILFQRQGLWEADGLDIFFGNGDTTFQTAPRYGVGLRPNSIVSADFNGDHYQDIATANTEGRSITILFNDGKGNFAGESSEIGIGGIPFILRAVDLNGDGNIDLIVSDTLNTALITLFGEGAGGFTAQSPYPLYGNPYDLALGDYNEDGYEDVAASINGNKLFMLFGDGSGSFPNFTQIDFSFGLTAIASADINGDGHLDLITREVTRFSILFGKGNGEFGQRRNYDTENPGGVVWDKIEVADFNNDGNEDIFVLSWLVGEIWLGDGEGGMTYYTEVNAQSSQNLGYALSDFNGDANIDIAMGGTTIFLFPGDGKGNFESAGYSYIANPIPIYSMACYNSFCSGDFNRDGASDLAIIHPDSNQVALLFGTKGLTHDVGVTSILSPVGIIPPNVAVVPEAEVVNLGTGSETFQVRFRVGSVYEDTITATLSSGQWDTVSFPPWVPLKTGNYQVSCQAISSVDQNPSNNLLTSSVTVRDTSGNQPFIASIWPRSGGNTGWVTTAITGFNFADSAEVKLVRAGEPDIVASGYQTEWSKVISSTEIQAVFNLTGVTRGNWDLLVANPGGSADTFFNAFEVEEGDQHLWLDICGLSNVTIKFGEDIPLTYYIYAGNSGNVNLDRVILEVDVPDYLKITSVVSAATKDTIAWGDSLEAYDIKNVMVPIYISVIPPGKMRIYECNVQTVWEEYPQKMGKRTAELGENPGFSVKGSLLNSALCFGKNLYQAYEKHDGLTLQDFEGAGEKALSDFVEGTFWSLVKLGVQILFPETIPFIQAYDLASTVIKGADLAGQLLGLTKAELAVALGFYWDPNDKAGPTGFSEKGYITDNRPYQYTIYFENVDTATAPVPDVVVIDTLDPDLNWSTLRFGASKHQLTQMELDTLNGIVTFTFNGINLPPNVNPPEGQSWFTYTIWPDSGLASGTEITNRASIIFRDSLGANEPILTHQVLNLIDNRPPTSSVNPLPSTVDYVSFKVSWSGHDSESGIYRYDVYVSDNGGDYSLWQQTEGTSAIFIGHNGHTYRFYSRAIDNVGFVEGRPNAPDAVTTIKAKEEIGVNPNPFVPARGHTVITFFGGSLPHSTIRIYNKAGRLVRTLREIKGKSTLEWDVTNDNGKKLASGVYIWVLSGPAGKDKGKFAIIR